MCGEGGGGEGEEGRVNNILPKPEVWFYLALEGLEHDTCALLSFPFGDNLDLGRVACCSQYEYPTLSVPKKAAQLCLDT